VGLATAWGLSRAAGIPLETVSTLEALAETLRDRRAARVLAALDAGRGDVVCCAYALDGARAVAASPGSHATSLAAIYSRPSAAEEKRGVAP
jgi:tRNA A37 threonylcarbamoyladenosine modification protein TsaB